MACTFAIGNTDAVNCFWWVEMNGASRQLVSYCSLLLCLLVHCSATRCNVSSVSFCYLYSYLSTTRCPSLLIPLEIFINIVLLQCFNPDFDPNFDCHFQVYIMSVICTLITLYLNSLRFIHDCAQLCHSNIM